MRPLAASTPTPPLGVHSRVISEDRVTEQNAAKVTTALAACEYSHSLRNCSQLSGIIVQLLVAWLAGLVQMKKTTRVRAMQRNANSARTNGVPRPRSNSASARLAISAPLRTTPNRLQPR